MKNTVNISLHVGDQIMDLRISNQVTPSRLRELLKPILMESKAIYHDQYDLSIKNKNIQLKNDQPLKDYGVSNGDQFIISFR